MSKIVNKSNFIIEGSLGCHLHLREEVEYLKLRFIILVNGKIVTFEERFYLDKEGITLQNNDWEKYYAIMKVLFSMGYYIPEEKNGYVSEDYCFESFYITDFIKSQRPQLETIEE